MEKKLIEKAKNVIFPITGGLGRNIFATAMIKNFKKEYPDKNIYVVAGFPDVFFNNTKIKEVYGFNSCQHLYERLIDRNPDTILLEVEPYRHPEYVSGNMHIVKAWCDLLHCQCDDVTPELYLTRNEKDMAQAMINNLQTKYGKPVILLQHTGGKIPNNNDKQEQITNLAVMHRRSLTEKTTQELVNLLSKDGYCIASIQSDNQFCPNGAEKIASPSTRLIMALTLYASGIIAIDSFLQHASAAFNIKSLVLWMGTSPDRLGYSVHKNLRRKSCETPECHRPNSYAFDIQANGQIWDCPFGDVCRDYDAKTIYNAYKEMKGKDYNRVLKEFVKPDVNKIIDINAKPHDHSSHSGSPCPIHK